MLSKKGWGQQPLQIFPKVAAARELAASERSQGHQRMGHPQRRVGNAVLRDDFAEPCDVTSGCRLRLGANGEAIGRNEMHCVAADGEKKGGEQNIVNVLPTSGSSDNIG